MADRSEDRDKTSVGQPAAPDVLALWEQYSESGSHTIKEQLIVHYTWLVRHVLSRLAISLPPSLDYGDLAGYGYIALVESIDRFEQERGFKFETYAAVRIKGAILDSIRSMDLVSRPVRRKMRQISEAVTDLTSELERMPSDSEVAERLGLSVVELRDAYRHGAASVVSLDSSAAYDDGDVGLALHESIADDRLTDPIEEVLRGERIETVAAAIGSMPERDQVLLSLYYYEGLNMREIGEVLSISESRVCQLHSKAVVYLRGYLTRQDQTLRRQAAAKAQLLIPA